MTPKKPRCMAAKFLRHVGDRPGNRHAIYAHCSREEHGEEGHHFVDGYGRAISAGTLVVDGYGRMVR